MLWLLVEAIQATFQCPSSPAYVHASCKVEVSSPSSCDGVRNEILARVEGQFKKWQDPHNNGTYSVISIDESTVSLQRLTGNKKYTDKLTFSLESSTHGCMVYGCSESQALGLA